MTHSHMGSAIAALVATTTLALFALGFTATESASAATATLDFKLLSASFIHIDSAHLFANLIGLLLVQQVFSRWLSVTAWIAALVFAAPAAHLAAVASGHYLWVAGLSSALHALVAWAALTALRKGTRRRHAGTRQFGLLVCAGLACKLALDWVWVTHWPTAQSAPILHLVAVLLGALAATSAGQAFAGLPAAFSAGNNRRYVQSTG